MKDFLELIFPKNVDNTYRGHTLALYTFYLLTALSTGRSIIHILASDGGANSIAGLDLSKGRENIIFAFGLWGISQLLLAFVQLFIAFKYRSLVSLFYLLFLFEVIGRMYIGLTKVPILLGGPPPGGIANYILLPVVVFMFILSLKRNK